MPAMPRLTARPGISLGLRLATVYHHPNDGRIEFHTGHDTDDALIADLGFAGEIQGRIWGANNHTTIHPRIRRDENGLPSLQTPGFKETVTAVRTHDTVLLHRPHEWLKPKQIHYLLTVMQATTERHRRLYITLDTTTLRQLGWMPACPWREYIDGNDARIHVWVADHPALVQPMIEQVVGIGHQVAYQGLTENGVACLGFQLDRDTNKIVPHPIRDFERAFDSTGVIVCVSLIDAIGDRHASRLLELFRSTPRRKQRLYLIDTHNTSLGLMDAATPAPGRLVPVTHARIVSYPTKPPWYRRLGGVIKERLSNRRRQRVVVVSAAKPHRSFRQRLRDARPTFVNVALYGALVLLLGVLALLIAVRW